MASSDKTEEVTVSSEEQHALSSEEQHAVSSEEQHVLSSEEQHTVSSEEQHAVSSEEQHAVSSEEQHAVSSEEQHAVSSEEQHAVSSEEQHAVSSEEQHAVSSEEQHAVSSGEQHTSMCNPCENEGTSNEAKQYCPECDDYLCDSCEVWHKRFKGTKNHSVMFLCVPAKSGPSQTENTTSADALCSCRRNKVSVYCENHADVACVDCKVLKHSCCNTGSIDEKCMDFDERILETTLQNSVDVKDKLTQFQINRADDLQLLSPMIKACQDGISSFKNSVCSEISMVLSNLETYDKKESSNIQQQIDTAKSAMANMVADQRFLDVSQTFGDKRLKFISNIRLTNKLNEINTMLDKFNKEVCKPRLLFNSEKAAGIVKSISNRLLTQERLHYNPKIVAKMHIKISKQLAVNMTSDKEIPWITGSTFMPSGELVLCDFKNSCVKAFDANFSAKGKISFPNPVLNLCVLNTSDVIVTRPKEKLLQFVQILPNLELRRSLPLDAYFSGVAAHQGEIYVTCQNDSSIRWTPFSTYDLAGQNTGEIRVLDTDGRLKRKIDVKKHQRSIFADSYYITISNQGSIFTTDYEQSVVRCLNLDGTLQAEYKSDALRNPLGVFVDDADNVFICGQKSNNVQIVVNYKTKDEDLISSADGISEPYSICFRDKDDTLVVTCKNNKLVFMFKLE